jgi:hypothetical protein
MEILLNTIQYAQLAEELDKPVIGRCRAGILLGLAAAYDA